jgi:hypothetical protein
MLQPIHTFIHRVGRLVFLDRGADPAANGELQRNATHVKVYSGGAVRNLSDVGTAPSHTHASHTSIGTGDHHAQLHAAAHKVAGGDVVLLDELGAPTDVTTLNASTTLHGLLPKLGGGTANFLRADGTWAAPGGGGAVTRAGGNTTEATTTSTTEVDILTVAALSIAVGVPVKVVSIARKAAGAVNQAYIALKLNTTVVRAQRAFTDNADTTGSAMYISEFIYGVANYLMAGGSFGHDSTGTSAFSLTQLYFTTAMPTATLTDIVIKGSVAVATTLAGHDEMHVYSHAVA